MHFTHAGSRAPLTHPLARNHDPRTRAAAGGAGGDAAAAAGRVDHGGGGGGAVQRAARPGDQNYPTTF